MDFDQYYTERMNQREDIQINEYQPIVKTDKSYMIKTKNGDIVSKLNFYEYKINNFDWILMADLDTEPKHRRKGLASKLINELYSDVSKKKKGLYMFVRDTNTDAINLYKKLGFSFVKKYTLKDGEYVIMAKGNADKSQLLNMNFS